MNQTYGSPRMRLGAVVGFYAGKARVSALSANRSIIDF